MSEAHPNVIRWLAEGSVGASSKTMAMWLAFATKTKWLDHPHDPDDFDRCLRLLAAAPELRPLLPRMAELTPEWAAIAKAWDEIEKSHLDEVGLNWVKASSAPKTYDLMRRILKPAEVMT